ncbi:MAG: Rne/Rng family ribonuclease [Myxococcota bacterium]
MQNEIVINATAGETRVGIVERNNFTELHIERNSEANVQGTVTKGRVTRVLPGMQAAFVDIGLEKAAFLYAGDYFDPNKPATNNSGRRGRGNRKNGGSRQPPSIDTMLREGQEIVVQIAKEPIGTKGARITSHISIAGRHLVLTPSSSRVGVSRRIDSDRERRRLREIVARVRPSDLGFIIRTAGDNATEADLEADVRYLVSVWDEIQSKRATATSPSDLYTELPLSLRVIRDFVSSKTKRIVIDNHEVYEQMNDFLTRFVAEPKPTLEHYTGSTPIFDHFKIESTIDVNLGKKIWLKSGGYLIVDQSEALTAIDVNTGRFVGKRDLEETVLRTNLEAIREVVYQLRFRNIGGIIIIDLIDMEIMENRETVYREFKDALRQDKAKTNILKISELGLVEMTRKRTRENLVQLMCEPCPYCEGRGYVLSSDSMAYKVLREIRNDLPRFCGRQIAVSVHPRVAEVLLGQAHKACTALSEELGREIEVRAVPGLHQEQFEVVALDAGPPVSLPLQWLSDKPEEPEADPENVLEETVEAVEEKPTVGPESDGVDSDLGIAVSADASTSEATASPVPDDTTEALDEPIPEPEAETAKDAPGGDPWVSPAESESESIAAPSAEVLDAEDETPILPAPASVEKS